MFMTLIWVVDYEVGGIRHINGGHAFAGILNRPRGLRPLTTYATGLRYLNPTWCQ